MSVEGSKVTVDRFDGGVAYVFTTQSGDVAQLRDIVRKKAERIEQRAGNVGSPETSATNAPSMAGDTSGASGAYPATGASGIGTNAAHQPTGGTAPVPAIPAVPSAPGSAPTIAGADGHGKVAAHAIVIDVDRGARLELRPLHSEDLDALRTHTEQRAAQMASGQCPSDMNAG